MTLIYYAKLYVHKHSWTQRRAARKPQGAWSPKAAVGFAAAVMMTTHIREVKGAKIFST
jgi:hypothetical protein